MIFVFLGIGCLLLAAGSEAVLRGGTRLLQLIGVPSNLISVVLVSLALSAPVFSVALQAAVRGLPDVALGVIAGSSLTSLLLVLGLAALLSPLPAPPRTVFRDMAALFVVSLVFLAVLFDRTVTPLIGALLIAAWLGYLLLAVVTELGRPQQTFAVDTRNGGTSRNPALSLFLLGVGVALLFFGARFTTDFAVVAARALHVPKVSFAATVVAFGTALPLLGAIVASAQRGHSYAASTRVLATMIFTLLTVLGVVALTGPLSVAATLPRFEAPLLAVCTALVAMLMLAGWRLTRWQGALLLLGYVGYVVSVGMRSGLFHA